MSKSTKADPSPRPNFVSQILGWLPFVRSRDQVKASSTTSPASDQTAASAERFGPASAKQARGQSEPHQTVRAIEPRKYRRALLNHAGPVFAICYERPGKARSDVKDSSDERLLVQSDVSPQSNPDADVIRLQVLDISHTGVSFSFPDQSASAWRTRFESSSPNWAIEIELNPEIRVAIQARRVRTTQDVVAFEFIELTNESRFLLDDFLDAKLIGLNMTRVDPSYFEDSDTQSEWFAGPRDTHLLLWASAAGDLMQGLYQQGDLRIELRSDQKSNDLRVGDQDAERAKQVAEQLAARLKKQSAPQFKLVDQWLGLLNGVAR